MRFQNLVLLGPPIGSVGRPCAVVASPGPCSLFDNDRIVPKRSEELASGFSMAKRELPMCLQMLDDRHIQDEALA